MSILIQALKNLVHLLQARNAAKQVGHPERQLKLIGITGTEGKTTAISALYHIMHNSGLKVSYVSTTEAKIGNKSLDTGLHVTSPEPWELPRYLKLMLDSGSEYVLLETTSQGLAQNRFGDIKFSGALITNIREDHLDYHKTWERYATAKFKLIKKLKNGALAVLNADDKRSAEWMKIKLAEIASRLEVVWVSKSLISGLELHLHKLQFTYKRQNFSIPVFGAIYNLENILQTIVFAESLLPLTHIRKALSTYTLPKGRMEVLMAEPFNVIVDFAHTPAALEFVLQSLRELIPAGKKLITVFGCAGKRDIGRRRMGHISASYADLTILTAEDPRNERVYDINTEIYSTAKRLGAEVIQRFSGHEDYALTSLGDINATLGEAWKNDQKPFIMFDEDSRNSRSDAIELALKLAGRGDVVLITGKGHEESLSFGKEEKEFAWTDQGETMQILKKLKKL